MMLKDLRVPQELDDSRSGLPPAIALKVVATSYQVGCGSHVSKPTSDVAAVCLAVSEDNTVSKYTVVLFLNLGRLADSRTEAANVVRGVNHRVKLWLDCNLGWIDLAKCIQDVIDENVEISLQIELETRQILRMRPYCILVHIVDLGDPERRAQKSNGLDELKERLLDKIIHVEGTGLRDVSKMPAGEVVFVLPDVRSTDIRSDEAVHVGRCKANGERVTAPTRVLPALMEDEPHILNKSKQERVEDLNWRVTSRIQT
jgi:hypothetical protein